jgi:hypothetical protein
MAQTLFEVNIESPSISATCWIEKAGSINRNVRFSSFIDSFYALSDCFLCLLISADGHHP